MKHKKLFWTALITLVACSWSIQMEELCAQSIQTFDTYHSGLNPTEQQQLSSLVNDVQPTAMLTGNGLNVAGSGPAQVLDIRAGDFSLVDFNDGSLAQVKLIRVRYESINDFSSHLDLGVVANLTQLTCVFLLSSVDVSQNQLDTAFMNTPANVSTCYFISIPE